MDARESVHRTRVLQTNSNGNRGEAPDRTDQVANDFGAITEQRKLAAILFTDVVGYSALSQRNDKLAQELLGNT